MYQAFCGQHEWYDSDISTTPCNGASYPGSMNNPGFGAANSGVTTDAFVWNFFATHPKKRYASSSASTTTSSSGWNDQRYELRRQVRRYDG